MLRKFKVKLNGKEYIVEMEEIGGSPAPVVTQEVVQPVQQPTQQAAPQPVVDVAGGTEVVSPMPGNILDVLVKVGDSVSENQTLLILEAMKMENNIVSPKAGVVAAINVKKSENIDVGIVMIVIK